MPRAQRGGQVLAGYLVPGEDLVVVHRQHWAVLAEPIASSLAGLVVLVVLTAQTDGLLGQVTGVLWLGWLVLLGRLGWRALQWSTSWFGATNRRMMLRSGVLTHKLAMMPLEKVTDMSYERSWAGHLLGYGQFVLESAGQDQALRVIPWVPEPDDTYRRLCSMIFAPRDKPASPATERPVAPRWPPAGAVTWGDDERDQPTVQVSLALPPSFPPPAGRPARPPED